MPSLINTLRVIGLGLVVAALAAADRTPDSGGREAHSEPWTRPYRELNIEVAKIGEKIQRNYYPEFLIIKGSDIVASVQVDAFGARVLKEAEELFQPYREGLMACVSRYRNEYRPTKTYSFERFAWFLDSYVKVLVTTIGEHAEPHMQNGVREKRVTTDRTLYAFTQLGLAYLKEKTTRQKAQGIDESAAEKKLETALGDIGRRVFRLDLTQKFDYRELIEKGPQSQPVFRSLANEDSRSELDAGLDPLATLMASASEEPLCPVVLPPAKP
jgi:hypothetical protein